MQEIAQTSKKLEQMLAGLGWAPRAAWVVQGVLSAAFFDRVRGQFALEWLSPETKGVAPRFNALYGGGAQVLF